MDATFESTPMTVRQIVDTIAPDRFRRDPLGLISGYRAYLVCTHLSGLADEELRDIGITRKDIPRVAGEIISKSSTNRAAENHTTI